MIPDQTRVGSKLIEELSSYLVYLKKAFGYRITLHHIEGMSRRYWPQLLPYTYHRCAVCREIKSAAAAWKRCVDRQDKVLEKAKISPYFGMCYAGVTEAVFPIHDIHDHCIGFLCVSGYTQDRKMSMERARAAACHYGLSVEKLQEAVQHLDDHLPDMEELSAQIVPVQTMLRMLFYFNNPPELRQEFSSARERMYYAILNCINTSFRDPDFSLKDVCARLNINYSYASHLFGEYSDLPFSRYLRSIRIEAAKNYLNHTTLPVIALSMECGFSDSNYFSSVFKKETGMTPSEYRAQSLRGESETETETEAETDASFAHGKEENHGTQNTGTFR